MRYIALVILAVLLSLTVMGCDSYKHTPYQDSSRLGYNL